MIEPFTKLGHLSLVNTTLNQFYWDISLSRVTNLVLQYNNINTLTINSSGSNNSSGSFDLRRNSITAINIDLDEVYEDEKFFVSLDVNPFDCDLSLYNLLDTNERNQQLSLSFGNATCKRPRRMQNQLLQTVNKNQLACTTSNYFSDCTCSYQEGNQSLQVQCNELTLKYPPDLRSDRFITNDAFAEKVNQVELGFSNNLLNELPSIPNEFDFNVTRLAASYNSIASIGTDNLSKDIRYLDLRNNSLKSLSDDVTDMLAQMDSILLGGNPWVCDCRSLSFFKAMKHLEPLIEDFDDMICENMHQPFKELSHFEICFNWPLVAVFAAVLAVLAMLVGLFYKYQKDIKIFLYAKNMCLWCVSEEELDEDKVYDAFICFAAQDQETVEELIFGLQDAPGYFKTLVGVRDWPPGEMIPELVSIEDFIRSLYQFN